MKIFFAIPSYSGLLDENDKPRCPAFMLSLVQTFELCEKAGHEVVPLEQSLLMGSCYIQAARNELVKAFRESGADILFFLDDDLSWNPADVLRLIEMPDEIVCGAYRYKTDREDYPIVIYTRSDGRAKTREDGCISACQVPTGFLRIKRSAIEKLCGHYPERRYARTQEGAVIEGLVDLFPQGLEAGQWIGDDYAFCRLWLRACGRRKDDPKNEIWLVPDLNLSHWGRGQEFAGNYHRYLLRQPGGRDAKPFKLDKAEKILGWLSLQEAEWLAEQAQKHSRIVELGCCYGRSTRAMADNTQGTILAIDNWNGPIEEKRDLGDIYAHFCENLHDHIESGRVVPMTANHAALENTALMFPGGETRPDMVFVDGDHGYASVLRDIRIWAARIETGGLLCGHDYNWKEVNRAVKEALPEAQQVPGTALWFWQVKEKSSVGIPEKAVAS